MMEQWNRDGGTVKYPQGWTVEHLMVEQLVVEQWNRNGGTVEHLMVEQWNRDSRTVEHLMLEKWNRDSGKVKHLMEHGATVEHDIVDIVEQWNI